MPIRSRAFLEIVRPQTATDRSRPAFDLPLPPPDLGAREAEIWRQVFDDNRQSTPLSGNVLHIGLLSHKLAPEAQEAVEAASLMVLGSDGQVRPHPLLSVIGDHRAGWLRRSSRSGRSCSHGPDQQSSTCQLVPP
jgi:hypothetical protein